MTTTTAFATQTRLADAAVAARGGANLLRATFDDRIPEAAFKASSDGTILITGVDLLKTGTFHGMLGSISLVDEDLDAMVARFAQLSDTGIFLPPLRLDHSWSVLSVVGWFESIETYERVDAGDGLSKTFLRGDVRVTGSVDYTAAQIVDAIKRGALRNRSSEVGPYMTNSGAELPLVFYGCAYVDIPAVEGLDPVSLSRRPEPHSITNLTANTTKGTTMTEAQRKRLAALKALTTLTAEQTSELATLSALPGADAVEADPAPVDEGGSDAGDDAGDEGEGEGDDNPEPVVETPPAPVTPAADDEVTELRRQVAALRTERANEQIARFRTTGAIVAENEQAATTLLTHDDEGVRGAAGTLLGSLSTRVDLGRRRGQTALSTTGNGNGEGGELIRLGMTGDEVGDLWRNLTRDERKLHKAELDAWQQDRDKNGIRD